MISGEALFVRSLPDLKPHLSSNNNIIPMTFQQFADDLLGASIGIQICGVKEIHSEIDSSFYYRSRFVNLDHPFFRVTERHSAQTYLRDLQPSLFKSGVLHWCQIEFLLSYVRLIVRLLMQVGCAL